MLAAMWEKPESALLQTKNTVPFATREGAVGSLDLFGRRYGFPELLAGVPTSSLIDFGAPANGFVQGHR